MPSSFCLGKGSDLCILSGKAVFDRGADGAMCYDNGSWFITGAPVLEVVWGKSGRNLILVFLHVLCFFVLGYICTLWSMLLQDLSKVITLEYGSILILLILVWCDREDFVG